MMTIQELEDKVWVQDNIRIVVRAAVNTQIGDYNYERAAQDNWRVTEFINKRLYNILNSLEVVVIMGNGEQAHGANLLRSVRSSYKI
jgi:hypothetical protein